MFTMMPSVVQAASGGGGGSDPYFANVVALLHFDGSYTDEKGHTWTPSGSPTFNTSAPMYGSGNMKTLAGTDYLLSQNSPDFALGAGDFTIELAVRFAAGSTPANVYIFDSGGGFGSAIQFVPSGSLAYYDTTTGSGSTLYTAGPSQATVCNGAKHKIAIVRVAGVITAYFDGVAWGSSPSTENKTYTSYIVNGYGGSPGSYGGAAEFDELRITKGIGRYTANYTPSTAPFPNS